MLLGFYRKIYYTMWQKNIFFQEIENVNKITFFAQLLLLSIFDIILTNKLKKIQWFNKGQSFTIIIVIVIIIIIIIIIIINIIIIIIIIVIMITTTIIINF